MVSELIRVVYCQQPPHSVAFHIVPTPACDDSISSEQIDGVDHMLM